ncbi:ABC transporter permease [Falsiroseomonas bella]|uniref:ABC transporter permease n=1 Tax=Falsiroseomonas bella TaxID=2184016 RepID=A0A317F8Q6_9PROT|nr:ABC transporter permease subunit [Falsiroseomonas bella]PWS34813.1 ABC transporter permease [Falsiroseomonas bella]
MTAAPALAAALAAAALLLPLPWLAIAPNRLLPGEAVTAVSALGWLVLPPCLLFGVAALRRVPPLAAAAAAMAAVLLLLVLTGLAASQRLQDLSPAARAGLGIGLWLALVSGLLLAALRLADATLRDRLLLAFVMLATLAAAAAAGAFDGLSLAVEYRNRAEAVKAALLRHLALAASALILALVVAAPLAWAGFRRPRLAGPVGAAFAGMQVVPGLALFALLIPLLSALLHALPVLREFGLAAIGAAPAVIATAAYLTLPLWRGLSAGLAAADPAAVAAAQAIGMGEARITREVRLPLALPVFAAGLRVALVQAIGLVTLGGLVGAGGLGALVFEGLAQFATDLMLLGAIPIVLLALVADALARMAETRLAVPA